MKQIIPYIALCLLSCSFTRIAKAQEQDQKINTTEDIRPKWASRDTALVTFLIQKSKRVSKAHSDSSVICLKEALRISLQMDYADGVVRSLLGLGSVYVDRGELDQGKLFFTKAYPYILLASPERRDRLIVRWCNSMALPYAIQGKYDTAIQYYYRALSESKQRQVNDTPLLTDIYSNLGAIWLETGQYDQALFYLKAGEAIATPASYFNARNIYSNFALTYNSLSDYLKARAYILKALSIDLNGPNPNKFQTQHDYYVLGKTYIDENDGRTRKGQAADPKLTRLAIANFRKAIQIDSSSPKMAMVFQGLAAGYYLNKEYGSAERYYRKALQLTYKSGLLNERISAYQSLARVYTDTRQFEPANHYQKAYSDLKDSMLNDEKVKANNLLEVRYRTAEKDKELAQNQLLLSQRQNQLQRKNLLIGATGGGVLLLSFLLATLYKSSKHKQRSQLEKMQRLQQEQEIGNLKSMIKGEEKERTRLARDLHDGIMVQLSAVKMNLSSLPKSYENDSDTFRYQQTIDQLEAAMKELRKTAHNLTPDMLLEGGLAEAVYYFCMTQQQSAGLKIIFQQQGELPRLVPEFELSLYRIIQELVQNIIKHSKATKAIVQFITRDDIFYVSITDNGIGFNPELFNKNPSGMGLKSIHTRVRALSGIIDIHSGDEGTAVYLEFIIRSIVNHQTEKNPD